MAEIEDYNLHLFIEPEEFKKDCQKIKIEPNKKEFDKYVKEFEKSVISEFNNILKNLKDYVLNYNQIMESEIALCDSKITNKYQRSRFIPVDKNIKKIEELLENVRNNHLENKIGIGLGE